MGNVPLFAAATQGAQPAGRRLTAVYIAAFAFVFMTFFFLTGLGLLRFFGISLPAFRIAGGIVLLLMGLEMTRGNLTHTYDEAEAELEPLSTRAYAAKRFELLIVPFGMPLLIGPGAISSAIIYAEEAHAFGATGTLVGIAVIFAVCLLVIAAFWLTSVISKVLGRHRHGHRGARAGPDPVRHGDPVHAHGPRRIDHCPDPEGHRGALSAEGKRPDFSTCRRSWRRRTNNEPDTALNG